MTRTTFLRIFTPLAAFLLPILTTAQANDPECIGLRPPHVIVGERGRVISTVGNNLRAEPTANSELIAPMPQGTEFLVMGGPTCAEEYRWWQVQVNDVVGWTIETGYNDYALMPIFPGAGQDGSASFEGVTFDYTANLSPTGIYGIQVNPIMIPPDDVMSMGGVPDALKITIDASVNSYTAESALRVFPLAAYELMNPMVYETAESLKQLLSTRPDLSTQTELPYLPLRNAVQGLIALPTYKDTEQFTGISYVTMFTQNTIQILDDMLVYVYQGISRDGHYYVSLMIPVRSTGVLPTEIDDALYTEWGQTEYSGYPDYILGVIDQLNQTQGSGFDPSLSEINALIDSLRIDPEQTLTETVAHPNRYGRYVDTNQVVVGEVCVDEQFPSRLTVGQSALQVVPAGVDNLTARLYGDSTLVWSYGVDVGIGQVVQVLGGPVCNGDVTTWVVYDPNRQQAGWVPEVSSDSATGERFYTFEPSDAEVELPPFVNTQTPTACQLLAVQRPTLYATPHTDDTRLGRLVDGLTYYADAQYASPDGGYSWWRLVPNALYLPYGANGTGEQTHTSEGWVLVNDFEITTGCDDIEQLAALG